MMPANVLMFIKCFLRLRCYRQALSVHVLEELTEGAYKVSVIFVPYFTKEKTKATVPRR